MYPMTAVLEPDLNFARSYEEIGRAYREIGIRRTEALNLLKGLIELARKRYVSPFAFALVYAGMEKRDQAFLVGQGLRGTS